MGLDMMLYRCNKPKLHLKNGILSDEERYKTENLCCFYEQDYPKLCDTIKKNCKKVLAVEKFYDLTMITMEICERNNIDYSEEIEENLKLYSSNNEFYEFKSGDYYLRIPSQDLVLYLINKKIPLYVIELKEIAYQRKGLNDRGWELMVCDNCDYSDDFEGVKKMVIYGGLKKDFIEKWEKDKTVFCPWW